MNFFRIGTTEKFPLRAWNRQSFLIFFAAICIAALAGVAAEFFGPVVGLSVPLLMVLLALALGDYRIGSGLLIFVMPFASTYLIPSQMFGISGMNPKNVLLLISISSLFLTQVFRPRKLAIPTWTPLFFMYLAVFSTSAIHGAFHASSIPEYFEALNIITSNSVDAYLLESFLKPSVTLATAFILSIVIRNTTRPNLYLIPLFCSAMVVAMAIFYHAASSGMALADLASQESRRYLSSTGMHANELGLLLNMAWALALFSFFHASRLRDKLLLGTVSSLLAIAILLTFSRGAYLGSLTVIGYLLYVRRKFLVFLLALLLLPIAALVMPQAVTERATHGMQSNDIDTISSGRVVEIWQPLLPEIMKSPLLGSGISSILWSDAAKQRAILPVGHPHSAYLGMLLDSGLLGAIIIILFFRHIWCLFTCLGRSAQDPLWRGFFTGAAACILLLLVQGVTDDSFMPTRTQPFLWLAYGMAIGFVTRQKAIENSAPLEAGNAPERYL